MHCIVEIHNICMCHNVSDGRVLDYFVRMQHKKKGGGVGMKGGKYQFKGILADSDSDHEPLVSAMPPTPAPVTAAKLKVSVCVHVEMGEKILSATIHKSKSVRII